MNPYLEQDDIRRDFHKTFLARLAAAVRAQFADHYILMIAEHLYVHELPVEPPILTTKGAAPGESPVPVIVPLVDVERLSRLEIRELPGRRLVTVIELLIPMNKYSGPDREQYLLERGRLLACPVHLVEIDLLRGGPRMPFASALPDCDYSVLVSRKEKRPRVEFWPIRLRDPLPVIPVPLREPDRDAQLDMQVALHQVYDEARYGNYIYQGSPEPALRREDAAWAQQFVPAQA
jgi:hypothetical protein